MKKVLVLLLLILPSWTNILLRINALASIFKPNNILQDIFNLPAVGDGIIGTDWAVLLGMVFTYLPFMIIKKRVNSFFIFKENSIDDLAHKLKYVKLFFTLYLVVTIILYALAFLLGILAYHNFVPI